MFGVGLANKNQTTVPFISPLLLTMTPALSSKYMKMPSFLRIAFRCRMTTAGMTAIHSNNLSDNKLHIQTRGHLSEGISFVKSISAEQ